MLSSHSLHEMRKVNDADVDDEISSEASGSGSHAVQRSGEVAI